MSRRVIISLLALLTMMTSAFAQSGTNNSYSPYSIYGVGDIAREGTAYTQSMGNVGIANRSKRYLNIINPAAVTARDSLSFMADFGLSGKAVLFNQGDLSSGNNTFNINNFAFSFPLFRHTAGYVGIAPYSNTAYDFTDKETNPEEVGTTGNRTYNASGNGSLISLQFGFAAMLGKRLSVGAEYNAIFGNIDKTTDLVYDKSSYMSNYSGYIHQLHAPQFKFGAQYEQPIGTSTLTVGATYKLKSNLKGYSTHYVIPSDSYISDTLKFTIDTLGKQTNVALAGELGLGISFRSGDKWSVEFDYKRADWRGLGMDTVPGFATVGLSTFEASVSQSFRAGFEYTPSRNDIRYYFRRCTYRAGAYYEEGSFRLDGHPITSMGLTFGATFPIASATRGYNAVTVAFDLGQRGSLKDNLIRERYFGFSVGFNIFDIWFIKQRYN